MDMYIYITFHSKKQEKNLHDMVSDSFAGRIQKFAELPFCCLLLIRHIISHIFAQVAPLSEVPCHSKSSLRPGDMVS